VKEQKKGGGSAQELIHVCGKNGGHRGSTGADRGCGQPEHIWPNQIGGEQGELILFFPGQHLPLPGSTKNFDGKRKAGGTSRQTDSCKLG